MADVEIKINGVLGEARLEAVLAALQRCVYGQQAPMAEMADKGDTDCPAPSAAPIGTKAVPHVGELWLTRGGGIAAVVAKESKLRPEIDPLRCSLLTKGDTAVTAPFTFTVGSNGRYTDPAHDHTLDLVKLHGSFLTP